MFFELLILDVDGILTDGTKVYDKDHNVLSKRYMCKDFSAIKRFSAANGLDEQKAIEEINKGVNYDPK